MVASGASRQSADADSDSRRRNKPAAGQKPMPWLDITSGHDSGASGPADVGAYHVRACYGAVVIEKNECTTTVQYLAPFLAELVQFMWTRQGIYNANAYQCMLGALQCRQ